MTSLNTGTTGAKRQSWRAANPRDLLRQLLEDQPTWSKERVLRAFLERVTENDEYIRTIIEYWFANNYHSLVETPSSSTQTARVTPETIKQSAETIKRKVQVRIQQEAQIILLDMQMPNGKKLSACTGLECQTLSSKVGGWLLRIAKTIKPSDVVGDMLSENQIRDLYAKTRT